MTRINRKIEYALMALKHMGSKEPGQLTSAQEVAMATGGPFDATARVMQVMAQKGLLRSEHGAHGGYKIVKDLKSVSVHEFIEMLTGPFQIVRCAGLDSECELIETCNIQSPVLDLNRRLSEFYRALNLGDLLRLRETP